MQRPTLVSIAETWLKPDNYLRIQGWARDGYTFDQIATNMGISHDTLSRMRKKYPKIEQALKISREILTVSLENSLYQRAQKSDLLLMFALKHIAPHKWGDHVITEDQKKAPSPKTINYYAEDQSLPETAAAVIAEADNG